MATESIPLSVQKQKFVGLSTDIKPTTGVSAKSTFKESDTGNVYEFSGSNWIATKTGGADHVVDGAFEFGPIYEDATYRYYGEAVPTIPRPLLAAQAWRVNRVNKTDGRTEWLDSGKMTQVYTDVATVAGLF